MEYAKTESATYTAGLGSGFYAFKPFGDLASQPPAFPVFIVTVLESKSIVPMSVLQIVFSTKFWD